MNITLLSKQNLGRTMYKYGILIFIQLLWASKLRWKLKSMLSFCLCNMAIRPTVYYCILSGC